MTAQKHLMSSPHPLFDPIWYRQENPHLPVSRATIQHYLAIGWKRGSSPHALFCVPYYMQKRPDVADCGLEPLQHFLVHGWKENTNPHPLVDLEHYLSQQPSLNGLDPVSHYLVHGWRQGLSICPFFSPAWYCETYPDVREADIEPLTHYLVSGIREGRHPSASLNSYAFQQRKERAGSAAVFAILPSPEPPEPGIKPPRLALKEPDWLELRERGTELYRFLRASRSELKELAAAVLRSKLEGVGTDESLSPDVLAGILAGNGPERSAAFFETVLPLGSVPAREHVAPPQYPVPILNRYNEFRIDVTRRFRPNLALASTIRSGPQVSVLMPIYKTPLAFLERAILSVLGQTYANWELVLVDDGSGSATIKNLLSFYTRAEPRIRCVFLEKNGGISAASNVALEAACGDYVGLLDHDDMLTVDALEHMADTLRSHPATDLVYSDECKIDENDVADDLFSKPGWSPMLLLNCMYTGHFSVYRTSLVRELGGFRSAYDFSQDYDLALRVAERTSHVKHVPKFLYGWRMIAGSAAVGDKPDARKTNIAALQAACERRGYNACGVPLPTSNRVKFIEPSGVLVSIIIPSDNLHNILSTVESISVSSTYADYEIVVVTNSSIANQLERRALPVRNVVYDRPYNFSDKCNAGAADAKGTYLVFFNDDVRVITRDWLQCLLEYLRLPGVGAVGPKLLYENKTIQHAGMVTGVRRLVGTAFHTFPASTSAHFFLAQSVREVSLLCGACLAISKELFDQVGGFDAENVPISHSDVDLCFRIRESGYACVYTPFAELTHIGHLSIGEAERKTAHKAFRKDKADIFLLRQWGQFCSRDPYYPEHMRDILYIDSQEAFRYFPAGTSAARGRDVLIFSHDLSGSGAPRIVRDMAKAFKKQNAYVLVIAPEDGPMRAELLAIGADVIIDPLALTQHGWIIALSRNFDVAIANTALCWPVVKALVDYIPVYWYLHETGLVGDLDRAFPDFAIAVTSATRIWAGSTQSARQLARFNVDVEVFPYGVDEAGVGPAPRRSDPNCLQVSLLATVEPRKGQDLAVLGYCALPNHIKSRLKLLIAGRVNDPHFAETVRSLAAGEDITFEKALDYQTYRERLRESDIILCPSRDDTLPLVSLDALSQGKILLCSKETGTSAYLEQGVSGFVLPANSPEEIAATLERIVVDYATFGRVVPDKARQVFKENFSRERFEERLLAATNFFSLGLHYEVQHER
jgi:GT2 family glycosyltransferase/glycosyltransferase involved in cell wall biosynthesis